MVAEYLAAGPPPGPLDLPDAAAYFADFAASARPEDHRAIRERGAAVAAGGREAVRAAVLERLDTLDSMLSGATEDSLIAVMSGRVMPLSEYLVTRVVEQAVHLDDLARSVGREPWPLPTGHEQLALSVGVAIARRRHGDRQVLRALYRGGFSAPVLPVL